MKPVFEGVVTALVTPFRDDRVDYDALGRLLELQLAAGVDGVAPCGSTGESATLTHEEHVAVVRFVVERVRGRVPVIAGTGSNSTAEAVALTRAAKEAGADAALLISPYYNKPTQEGIYRHYRTIAEQTRFPLILYNIPGRTGSKIEAETIARLAELDEVVGLKEATGSLDEVQRVLSLCGDRLAVYAGDDALALPILAVGGRGVISVISNVLPAEFGRAVRSALRGAWEEARAEHFRLLPLMHALFLETNPIPVKALLSAMGICRDELRLPLVPMSDGPRKKLLEVARSVGVALP
ncbi:MAG: 4-hydroxy-tetrahydrodipicolinate synthase [Candidatus Binatia bacterium]|nr:MAG: 4-hydroxy-tetrahydrodipicolinate synthase [Candidatus Binatia bacterium]